MPLVTVQRSHLVAAAAIAIVGLLAFRGPWSTQAAPPNGIQAFSQQGLAAPQVVYVDQYGRPLTVAPATQFGPVGQVARPMPAAIEPAYSTAPQPQPYVRPVSTVRTSSAPRTVRVSEHRRSWQKSALIIGGSAGTGAGVGALIGGKKGAAIGAAIGGGGAALYEAVKR